MVYPALFTVPEVAKKLGISTFQVYRRIHRGDLKAELTRGARTMYLIHEDKLNEYVAAGGPKTLSPLLKIEDEWVSTSEVALLTGHDPVTIRNLCYQGCLAYVKGKGVRGQLRIWMPSVRSFFGTQDDTDQALKAAMQATETDDAE